MNITFNIAIFFPLSIKTFQITPVVNFSQVLYIVSEILKGKCHLSVISHFNGVTTTVDCIKFAVNY